MFRIFLSLFIALSVLIAPIAHAFDMDEPSHYQSIDKKAEATKEGLSHDNEKKEQTAHHCCAHLSTHADMHIAEPEQTSIHASFMPKQDAVNTLTLGPALKPPSHV